MQSQPFIHLDSDVYLWKPVPDRMLTAPVLAQNPEDAVAWYNGDWCERIIRLQGDGWIPLEWSWYRLREVPQKAACCGIVGGNDLKFFRRYASTVIRILGSRRNRSAFDRLSDKKLFNAFFEQYLLCAFAAFEGIRVEYLFESFEAAMTPGRAAQMGYTHLQSTAKSQTQTGDRLEQRVARDYPETYKRCNDLARRLSRCEARKS